MLFKLLLLMCMVLVFGFMLHYWQILIEDGLNKDIKAVNSTNLIQRFDRKNDRPNTICKPK